MQTKTCTRCGEVKPLDAYYRKPHMHSWCKACCNHDNSRRKFEHILRRSNGPVGLIDELLSRVLLRRDRDAQRASDRLAVATARAEAKVAAEMERQRRREARKAAAKARCSERNRAYRLANLERLRAKDRARSKTPAKRAANRQRDADRYANDPAFRNAVAAHNKAWREANRPRMRVLQALNARGISSREVEPEMLETLTLVQSIKTQARNSLKENSL